MLFFSFYSNNKKNAYLRSKNTLEFKLTTLAFRLTTKAKPRGFKTNGATEILRQAKHVIVSVRLTHKYLEKWTKDVL